MHVAAGAKVAQVWLAGVIFVSVTITLFCVTVPVLVAVTVKVSVSPKVIVPEASWSKFDVSALAMPNVFTCATGVVIGAVIGVVIRSELADPVLAIDPVFTSVCATL